MVYFMLSSFIDINKTNKYVSHIFYLHSWTEKVQLQGQADHLGCVMVSVLFSSAKYQWFDFPWAQTTEG